MNARYRYEKAYEFPISYNNLQYFFIFRRRYLLKGHLFRKTAKTRSQFNYQRGEVTHSSCYTTANKFIKKSKYNTHTKCNFLYSFSHMWIHLPNLQSLTPSQFNTFIHAQSCILQHVVIFNTLYIYVNSANYDYHIISNDRVPHLVFGEVIKKNL